MFGKTKEIKRKRWVPVVLSLEAKWSRKGLKVSSSNRNSSFCKVAFLYQIPDVWWQRNLWDVRIMWIGPFVILFFMLTSVMLSSCFLILASDNWISLGPELFMLVVKKIKLNCNLCQIKKSHIWFNLISFKFYKSILFGLILILLKINRKNNQIKPNNYIYIYIIRY